jgi:hypothetical protein
MSKKKKPTEKATKTSHPMGDQALLGFLLEQAGGKELAMKRFAIGRFQGLDKGMTLDEAMNQAKEEGWGEVLGGMTLNELRGPRAPNRPRVAGGNNAPRKRADMAKVTEDVVEALGRAKGPQTARAVADEIGDDPRRVARVLSALVADGKATREGSKRTSVYSLA